MTNRLALLRRQLRKHWKRQHFVRCPLRMGKLAGGVTKVRERGKQMHRDRIVNSRLNPLLLQRFLPRLARTSPNRINVIDVPRV